MAPREVRVLVGRSVINWSNIWNGKSWKECGGGSFNAHSSTGYKRKLERFGYNDTMKKNGRIGLCGKIINKIHGVDMFLSVPLVIRLVGWPREDESRGTQSSSLFPAHSTQATEQTDCWCMRICDRSSRVAAASVEGHLSTCLFRIMMLWAIQRAMDKWWQVECIEIMSGNRAVIESTFAFLNAVRDERDKTANED